MAIKFEFRLKILTLLEKNLLVRMFLLLASLLVYCEGNSPVHDTICIKDFCQLYLVIFCDHIRNISVCSTELDNDLWKIMM